MSFKIKGKLTAPFRIRAVPGTQQLNSHGCEFRWRYTHTGDSERWATNGRNMKNWKFILALHNLPVSEIIGNNYIQIVPLNDDFGKELRKKSKVFSLFIDNFVDQFKRPSYPSLLIFNSENDPSIESLVSFRNALAISSISKAWTNYISHGSQSEYYKYSDYFEFYPYSMAKNEEYLYAQTPSFMGVDDPKKFLGQSSPGIAKAHSKNDFYDKNLFDALLEKWCEYFIKKKQRDWSLIALFRSLEMAYRASAMPFGNQGSLHDYGANISLWVSAFEILVHPKSSWVGVLDVLKMLGEIRFCTKSLTRRKYRAKITKNRKPEQLTLIQKTFFEMHRARNNFLHGNPVSFKDLFPARNTKYPVLNFCAPLVYKYALEVFLGINRDIDLNDLSNVKEFIRCRNNEEALQNIRKELD